MGEIICTQCQGPADPVPGDSKASARFFMTVTVVIVSPSYLTVRKQEIIKVTEQLIEAISNGDFESYT